jgi:hypothetical protein
MAVRPTPRYGGRNQGTGDRTRRRPRALSHGSQRCSKPRPGHRRRCAQALRGLRKGNCRFCALEPVHVVRLTSSTPTQRSTPRERGHGPTALCHPDHHFTVVRPAHFLGLKVSHAAPSWSSPSMKWLQPRAVGQLSPPTTRASLASSQTWTYSAARSCPPARR